MFTMFKPLRDKVLVQRIKGEDTSEGGIHIPEEAREKPMQGVVVAVGNGRVLEDGTVLTPEVQTDDRVLFGRFAGTEIQIEGQEYLILTETDILGKFTPKK